MFVPMRFNTNRHRRLGQALVAIALDIRMHQFTYFGAVFGDVWNDGAGRIGA